MRAAKIIFKKKSGHPHPPCYIAEKIGPRCIYYVIDCSKCRCLHDSTNN